MSVETNSYLHFEKHQSQFTEQPIILMGGRLNTKYFTITFLVTLYRTNIANDHVKEHEKIETHFTVIHLHDD